MSVTVTDAGGFMLSRSQRMAVVRHFSRWHASCGSGLDGNLVAMLPGSGVPLFGCTAVGLLGRHLPCCLAQGDLEHARPGRHTIQGGRQWRGPYGAPQTTTAAEVLWTPLTGLASIRMSQGSPIELHMLLDLHTCRPNRDPHQTSSLCSLKVHICCQTTPSWARLRCSCFSLVLKP